MSATFTKQVSEALVNGGPQTNVTTTVTTTYYVRSSVTGDVFNELDEQGNKRKSYIHAFGARLAEQRQVHTGGPFYVFWRYANPVTGALIKGDDRTEFDPFGAEVGNYDPYYSDPTPTYQELKGNEPLYIEGGDPFNLSGGCTRDGLPISCSEAYRQARSGSVVDSNGADVVALAGGTILRGVFGEKYVNGDYAGDVLVDIGSFWLPLAQQQGGGQQQQMTDCERFATIVGQIANGAANVDEFMQRMVNRFIGLVVRHYESDGRSLN
jgi:hypothetical protein